MQSNLPGMQTAYRAFAAKEPKKIVYRTTDPIDRRGDHRSPPQLLSKQTKMIV